MDTERPHKTSSNSSSSTSELFVCFTSRLSSSSMKLSSKSLLSPSRSSSRDPPQISLSSSLSRRLRSNGSMKGGGQASPMFPSVGKRRGCGFENPEPSSPKVTCIGQVRVKTKKQGKKMRARSKRRSEASFRKIEQGLNHHHVGGGANSSDLTRQNSSSFQYQQDCLKHRNQRWVHLPLTICEALREFNCFFPCRSSCMRDKGEKGVEDGSNGGHGHGHGHHHHHHGREGSCGAAFARWLHVALQEGGGDDDGKGREIEVVMREEDEVEDVEDDGDDGRSYRRHVFEDINIDVVEGKKKKEENNDEGVEEEEKARVSICIPPKNALLLMRCRSDPVKMAALANRFWESPVHKGQHEVEDEEEVVEEQQQEADEEQKEVEMEEHGGVVKSTEESRNSICEREREGFVENEEEEAEAEAEVMESLELENRAISESSEIHEANQAKEEEDEQQEEQEKDEDEEGNANLQEVNFSCVASNIEAHSDLDKPEKTQESLLPQGEEENNEEKNQNDKSSELSSTPEKLNASEPQNDEEAAYPEPEQAKTTTIAEALTEAAEEEESSTEEEQHQQQQNVTIDTPPPPPPEVAPPTQEGPDPNNEPGSEERENGSKGERENREREKDKLPECLLLMMCEPKLSMEVSKETWVCSTDFIRWLPERPAGKIPGGGGRRVSVAEGKNGVEKKASPAPAAAPPVQPPRSSCSFPAAAGVSMAAMIEQRLATVGTKSNGYEPFVLTRCKSEPMRSTAKLAADACFWKKPHAPPATLGVGAPAGVGF